MSEELDRTVAQTGHGLSLVSEVDPFCCRFRQSVRSGVLSVRGSVHLVIRHKPGSVVDDCFLVDSGIIGRASLDTMIDYSEISLARTVSIWMHQARKEVV